jgi:hypothetical protein
MGGDAVSGGEVGGGGGGSSLVPANGSLTLAPLGTPPAVLITGYRHVISLALNGRSIGVLSFDSSDSGFTSSGFGVGSALGAFRFTNSGSLMPTGFNPPLVPYSVTGTQTLVAGYGDRLTGTLSGVGVNNIDTSAASGTNVITITGGTGRFANATGAYTVTYTSQTTSTVGTISSGPVTATIRGNINLGIGGAVAHATHKTDKRRHLRWLHFRPRRDRVA